MQKIARRWTALNSAQESLEQGQASTSETKQLNTGWKEL